MLRKILLVRPISTGGNYSKFGSSYGYQRTKFFTWHVAFTYEVEFLVFLPGTI